MSSFVFQRMTVDHDLKVGICEGGPDWCVEFLMERLRAPAEDSPLYHRSVRIALKALKAAWATAEDAVVATQRVKTGRKNLHLALRLTKRGPELIVVDHPLKGD